MPIPVNTQRRVAHIDVLTQGDFSRSVSYWRLGFGKNTRWSTVDTQSHPMLIGSDDAIVVDCDSNSLISNLEGGVVHVNGDINAELETDGSSEIIIGGDVSARSTIRADGYAHIYIAGSVFGRIELQDRADIWVDGDFSGSLATGFQSTRMHVLGDFDGDITSPHADPSLLYLDVGGFAASKLISSICSIGYAQFNASIAASDVEPGLYPHGPGRQRTAKGASYFQWCVHSRRK